MPRLPLFPLGTVLLPGAPLPLLVFEPRYVTLLEDRLRPRVDGEPTFGVVAIRKGQEVGEGAATELHRVGCEAVIEEVSGTEPPYHVLAHGRRRFTLDGIDEDAGTPYTTGVITWIDPVGGEPEPPDEARTRALAKRVRSAHAILLTLIGAEHRNPLPTTAAALAYRIAERTPLELVDRQSVLEAPTSDDRLAVMLRLLKREIGILGRVRAVPGRIEPGHFSPN